MCMYIHICVYMYIYIYIYIYIYMYRTPSRANSSPRAAAVSRPRENMVGVNMVLAEFIKFKHGLYTLWYRVF